MMQFPKKSGGFGASFLNVSGREKAAGRLFAAVVGADDGWTRFTIYWTAQD